MPQLIAGIGKRVVTAYELKTYAGLSNRVDISDDSGDRIAYIRPPMWAFTFASDVMRVPLGRVGFYLEQVGNVWLFGVDYLDAEWSMDCILYRRKELPYWAGQEYQRHLRKGTECPL